MLVNIVMDFFLKTIHFIKYFKVHLRIKNRDFYPLDFDTGKKIEEETSSKDQT